MDETIYAAARIDNIRANYRAGLITRDEALNGIKDTVRVTDVGAANLLDAAESASYRYAFRKEQP